jgi:ADP-heptose:LPS heptosyltransferase
MRKFLRGLALLRERPRALPANLALVARYLWNVKIRRRKPLVVVRSGGMGDFVSLLASLRSLRTRHANSWLVLICPPGCSPLAAASGLCDIASETQSIFHKFVKTACPQSHYYYMRLPDERSPPQSRQLHLAEEFASALQVSVDFSSVHFTVPLKTERRIARSLKRLNPQRRPIIVMHAGPAWPVREWPIEHWAELSEKIGLMTSAIIIQIGNDWEAGRQLVRPLRIPHTIDWVNKLGLVELVALLELTNVYVGIDSGPLHVATAVGVPSIGLFGPTDAHLLLYPRARTTIIGGAVTCLGCHHSSTGPLHWRTGCPNDIACMHDIRSDQVLDAVRENLG